MTQHPPQRDKLRFLTCLSYLINNFLLDTGAAALGLPMERRAPITTPPPTSTTTESQNQGNNKHTAEEGKQLSADDRRVLEQALNMLTKQ